MPYIVTVERFTTLVELVGYTRQRNDPEEIAQKTSTQARITTYLCLLPYEFIYRQLQLNNGIASPMKQSKHKVERLRQRGPHLQLLRIGNLVVYSNLVICTS